ASWPATREEVMQRPWQGRGTLVAQHAGARGWDDASQFLLRGAMAPNAGPGPAPVPQQAAPPGSRVLRPGLDEPSAPAADDGPTLASPPRLRGDPPRGAGRRSAPRA